MKHTQILRPFAAASIAALALLPLWGAKRAPRILDGWQFRREMPAFLDSIQAELTYPLSWQRYHEEHPSATPEQWRKEAREAVRESMLLLPRAAERPKPVLVAEERRDGYTARRYEVRLTDWYSVPFLMLVPDTPGPHPAVLLLHDHGGHYTIGKEKMIRPFASDSLACADADAWARQCYGGRYVGDMLAREGYVVAAHDALLWGDRGREEGENGDMLQAVAGNLQMLGASLSGLMAYDDSLMTDVLASMPETDPERIGAMGFSMGAYRAWMLAAINDRVKAFSAVCWMTTTASQLSWEHGREKGGHANILPGLRRWLDYPHIASLAAPRAAYFINGRTDKLFHPEGVEAAYGAMRAVWDDPAFGAPGHLRTELWEQGHDCGIQVQDSILKFFRTSL